MQEVVVTQAFFANGHDRRPGELLPKSGPNMPLLVKSNYVTVLDEECEGAVCTQCQRRFYDTDVLRAHTEIEHGEESAPPVEPRPVTTVTGMEPAPDGTLKPAHKRKTNQE